MKESMKITKDVINDLLPVYLSGEASGDTRALVEDYLRSDPALAADVRSQAEKSAALLSSLGPSTPPDQEVATFDRIRRYNRYSNQLAVFALLFNLSPFIFVFDGSGGITWMMLRDNPKQALMFFIAAGICWIARAVLMRRMSR